MMLTKYHIFILIWLNVVVQTAWGQPFNINFLHYLVRKDASPTNDTDTSIVPTSETSIAEAISSSKDAFASVISEQQQTQSNNDNNIPTTKTSEQQSVQQTNSIILSNTNNNNNIPTETTKSTMVPTQQSFASVTDTPTGASSNNGFANTDTIDNTNTNTNSFIRQAPAPVPSQDTHTNIDTDIDNVSTIIPPIASQIENTDTNIIASPMASTYTNLASLPLEQSITQSGSTQPIASSISKQMSFNDMLNTSLASTTDYPTINTNTIPIFSISTGTAKPSSSSIFSISSATSHIADTPSNTTDKPPVTTSDVIDLTSVISTPSAILSTTPDDNNGNNSDGSHTFVDAGQNTPVEDDTTSSTSSIPNIILPPPQTTTDTPAAIVQSSLVSPTETTPPSDGDAEDNKGSQKGSNSDSNADPNPNPNPDDSSDSKGDAKPDDGSDGKGPAIVSLPTTTAIIPTIATMITATTPQVSQASIISQGSQVSQIIEHVQVSQVSQASQVVQVPPVLQTSQVSQASQMSQVQIIPQAVSQASQLSQTSQIPQASRESNENNIVPEASQVSRIVPPKTVSQGLSPVSNQPEEVSSQTSVDKQSSVDPHKQGNHDNSQIVSTNAADNGNNNIISVSQLHQTTPILQIHTTASTPNSNNNNYNSNDYNQASVKSNNVVANSIISGKPHETTPMIESANTNNNNNEKTQDINTNNSNNEKTQDLNTNKNNNNNNNNANSALPTKLIPTETKNGNNRVTQSAGSNNGDSNNVSRIQHANDQDTRARPNSITDMASIVTASARPHRPNNDPFADSEIVHLFESMASNGDKPNISKLFDEGDDDDDNIITDIPIKGGPTKTKKYSVDGENNLSWLPTSIQYAPTIDTTAAVTPESMQTLPAVITPSKIIEASPDCDLITIGFQYKLHYSFLVSTPLTAAQVFDFLPYTLYYPIISHLNETYSNIDLPIYRETTTLYNSDQSLKKRDTNGNTYITPDSIWKSSANAITNTMTTTTKTVDIPLSSEDATLKFNFTSIQVKQIVPYMKPNSEYITSVAEVYFPKEYISMLQNLISDPNSIIYKNPKASFRTIANLIDSSISITALFKDNDNQNSSNSNDKNSDASSRSKNGKDSDNDNSSSNNLKVSEHEEAISGGIDISPSNNLEVNHKIRNRMLIFIFCLSTIVFIWIYSLLKMSKLLYRFERKEKALPQFEDEEKLNHYQINPYRDTPSASVRPLNNHVSSADSSGDSSNYTSMEEKFCTENYGTPHFHDDIESIYNPERDLHYTVDEDGNFYYSKKNKGPEATDENDSETDVNPFRTTLPVSPFTQTGTSNPFWSGREQPSTEIFSDDSNRLYTAITSEDSNEIGNSSKEIRNEGPTPRRIRTTTSTYLASDLDLKIDDIDAEEDNDDNVADLYVGAFDALDEELYKRLSVLAEKKNLKKTDMSLDRQTIMQLHIGSKRTKSVSNI